MHRTFKAAFVLAVIAAVGAVALALLPGPLYRFGWVDLPTAFSLLANDAPPAAIAAAALGLLAAFLAFRRRRWVLFAVGVGAIVAGLGVILTLMDLRQTAAANPLHDVTTNLDSPPGFEVLSPRRYEADGRAARAAYPHPDWRATHAEIYPDLATATLTLTLDQAIARVRETAEVMGWAIEAVETTDASARLEAVAKTGWFGFEDDVVVLITALSADEVAIDARSVSRIGVSDLGANAARLRAFFDLL